MAASSWAARYGSEAVGGCASGALAPAGCAMLLGGNLASEMLFALDLGTFTAGLGYPVGLGELLLINIGVGSWPASCPYRAASA